MTWAFPPRAGRTCSASPFPRPSGTAWSRPSKRPHVYVGARGDAIRISPHLHTTDEDVDRLFGALDRVLARR